jgi:LysR family transcriptional regulator, low CO2-responsive transcriptional regulator
MKNATLRQLQVFEAVARNLSFARAAEELHLTQPAVSLQIKQLAQHAGLPLFEQMGKKIYMTEAGREMLAYSHTIMQRIKEAEEVFAALRGASNGQLNIAVVSTAKYFAPQLLAAFRKRHPNASVKLAVNNREFTVRQLLDNETDLAIMGRPPAEVETIAESFARHPLGIIAAPDHALAHKRRTPLKRLVNETFILREKGSGTRAAMETLFSERDFVYQASMEISSNETIKQAVIAGMGISFLSLHTVGLELSSKRLIALDIAGLPVMRNWFVIHRVQKRLSPLAQEFKTFLLNDGAALLQKAVK